MHLEFSGEIFCWRGPAPFYFVAVPDEQCEFIRAASKFVSYGWGVIPVRATIGSTEWKTSLFPKEGLYLVPIKAAVRKEEGIAEGDTVALQLAIGP